MKIKSYFLLTLLLMTTVAFGSVKPIPVTAATIEWKAYKIAYERWGTIELESGELDFEEGTLTGGNFVVNMTRHVYHKVCLLYTSPSPRD